MGEKKILNIKSYTYCTTLFVLEQTPETKIGMNDRTGFHLENCWENEFGGINY
jgi:hypothetical protein